MAGIVLVWGAYLAMKILLSSPGVGESAPAWIGELLPALLSLSVVISGLAFALASSKSMLPAMLALVASILLAPLGLPQAAFAALYIAGASSIVYAMTRRLRN